MSCFGMDHRYHFITTFLVTVGFLLLFGLLAANGLDCHCHTFRGGIQSSKIRHTRQRQQRLQFVHTPRFATPNSGSSTLANIRGGDDNEVDFLYHNIHAIDPSSHEKNIHHHHARYMKLALQQAEQARRKGEVPIGAVVVQRRQRARNMKRSNNTSNDEDDNIDEDYEILSQAHNLVETRHDASAHAELVALQLAGTKIQNWRLTNTTLYSTLEPCPMCLAAAQAFRVSAIVYAAPDLRLGAIHTHMRLLYDYQHPYHTIDTVVPGILKEESASLLKSFFQERRRKSSMGSSSKKSVALAPPPPSTTTTTSTSDKKSERGIRWRNLNGSLKGVFRVIFRHRPR
jgi:tRNA(adenine34) deaminase